MSDLIKHLNEPEVYFPGNFDTVKRANAMLSCLCQEAADALEAKDAEIATLHGALDAKITICGDAEIAKYKALCDQLGEAITSYIAFDDKAGGKLEKALAAWKEMK